MSTTSGFRWAARALVATLLVASGAAASLARPPATLAAPSRSELETAQDRLADLERDFELVVERYNLTNERLESIQADLGRTSTLVDEIEERIAANEEMADAVAVELYKDRSSVALESVLSARSLADIETRLQYLSSSQGARTEIFKQLAEDDVRLERAMDELERRRAAAMAAQGRLDELRAEIEGKVSSQKREIARLTAVIEAAERREELRERREAQAAAEAAAEARAAAREAGDDAIAAPAPAPNDAARIAVETALAQVGKPYVWAADGPESFDCSGLTMYAWAAAGVSLPHQSGMQYEATARVERSDLQPGDLMFFGSPIHHVTMYIGNGQMVEAPYTGALVRVVGADRWDDYVGAGRPGV